MYDRSALRSGQQIDGPAIIEQLDSTTLIWPGEQACIDAWDQISIAGLEKPMKTDPITLELMRNRWTGIAEENVRRTDPHQLFHKYQGPAGLFRGIVQPTGEILAQAESGVPLHLGVMPGVVKSILEVYPVSAMKPRRRLHHEPAVSRRTGPSAGCFPVSAYSMRTARSALAASTAHHVDMGGFAPGSMPFGVTEIYQEGLQIPPLPIFKADSSTKISTS